MNAKILSSIAAMLALTSAVGPAIAAPLSDHPAVVVTRTWNSRAIDPNTFVVQHPAGHVWLNESPTAKRNATLNVESAAVTAQSQR